MIFEDPCFTVRGITYFFILRKEAKVMETVFANGPKLVKSPIMLGDLLATGSVCPFLGKQTSYRKQVPVPSAYF